MRLDDVIRSGLRHPDSNIGIYAPDAQSYDVFRELFEPILGHFHAPSLSGRTDMACINPAAVVSTRIRVACNLAGYAFPAGMSRPERITVEKKLVQACRLLAPDFQGTVMQLKDVPQDRLDHMVSKRLAFGPDDKYMLAAGIHADWPQGRSVFNTHAQELSVWINEEDHLRVAAVLPGASVRTCYGVMRAAMSRLAAQLDFCEDAQHGFLTSCPSNAGSTMRVTYRIDLSMDTSQQALLAQLESAGVIDIRSTAGEHSPRSGSLVDIGFRHRVGVSETQMLQDMDRLFMKAALPA